MLSRRLFAPGRLALAASVLGMASLTPPAQACSSCGCTLNADWATQGLVAGNGWNFDLRQDYFVQDDLRSGSGHVARSSIQLPAEREIQRYTINRNTTATVDFSPAPNWGLTVQLPWYDRPHATYDEGETELSHSRSQGIGDLRLLARYQGFDPQHSRGIQFGLKLPTGRFTDTFDDGPLASERVDRGLQPGTGTTDLLLGAYAFGALAPRWDYFAHALLQQPLDSRSGFRPGTGVNLNAGVRFVGSNRVQPQLQVNARIEGRESGVNADRADSGATLVYFSPGVTLKFSRRLSAFAFVQAPLYQRVNGLQIEPRWSISVGANYRL